MFVKAVVGSTDLKVVDGLKVVTTIVVDKKSVVVVSKFKLRAAETLKSKIKRLNAILVWFLCFDSKGFIRSSKGTTIECLKTCG